MCFAVLLPATFLHLRNQLDALSLRRGALLPGECEVPGDMALSALAALPPSPVDARITLPQRKTRALLACVLPFDVDPSSLSTGSAASSMHALQALLVCQRELRDTLRLSAVAAGLEVSIEGVRIHARKGAAG